METEALGFYGVLLMVSGEALARLRRVAILPVGLIVMALLLILIVFEPFVLLAEWGWKRCKT